MSQYILEETTFKEGSFENVARRILKTQKKLGKLKGVTVSTLSLSDSRKNRLKSAGLFSAVALSGAALAGAGIVAGVGAAKGASFGHKLNKIAYSKSKTTKEKAISVAKHGYYGAKTEFQTVPHKARMAKADALNKVNSLEGNKKKAVLGGAAFAGASALSGGAIAAGVALSKQQVIVEAKFAYGTKLFHVYNATKEEVEAKVDKQILKVLTQAIAKLKTAKEWAVKESASPAFIQSAVLAESMLEEVLSSQLQETFLIETYILEDEEEGAPGQLPEQKEEDEELAEACIFEEDEEDDDAEAPAEADDEELAEAYIFEEDEEDDDAETPAEADDEEENDEELAEAYFF